MHLVSLSICTLLTAAVTVLEAHAAQAASIAAPLPVQASEEVVLAVRINGQAVSDGALLLKRGDAVWARKEDLQQWRLLPPDAAAVVEDGFSYLPLDSMQGLTYSEDPASQTLIIEAEARLFESSVLQGNVRRYAPPRSPSPGGYFNYDVLAEHTEGRTHTSGYFGLSAFNAWGSGSYTFIARDSVFEHLQSSGQRVVRLDTTWTQDKPEHRASLRFGDAIGVPGQWGRSVRFGGVQWATNFATQPGFIAFPLPGVTGEAVIPSTVDLYVNGALRLRRDVPVGPFRIEELPVVTGEGAIQAVVRDAAGREQVITQGYYASPRLLKAGLSEFSYELGAVRHNYALKSNDYGRGLGSATHRFGFTDALTGEARAELLRDQQTAGLAGAWQWPLAGIVSAAVAGSHREQGSGGLLSVGYEQQGPLFGLGAFTQCTSPDFIQLGMPVHLPAPRRMTQARASMSLGHVGSVAVNYTIQDRRDAEALELAGASYSRSLGKFGFIGASLLRSMGEFARTTGNVFFVTSLDSNLSLSASRSGMGGEGPAQWQLQAQRSIPSDTGVGYRVGIGDGAASYREAGVRLQSNFGDYGLDAAQFGKSTRVRAHVAGGLALLDGRAYLGRGITDSFAVVHLPDHPDVPIRLDNHIVARTRADGTALIPRLRAYEENKLRVDPIDLPLDSQLNELELVAVPFYRTGLVMRFPVQRQRSAVMRIVLDDGQPIPSGALVRLSEQGEEFPVGLRGEVYVKGLSANNRLSAQWRGHGCVIDVAWPDSQDLLPDLGTHTCSGVAR